MLMRKTVFAEQGRSVVCYVDAAAGRTGWMAMGLSEEERETLLRGCGGRDRCGMIVVTVDDDGVLLFCAGLCTEAVSAAAEMSEAFGMRMKTVRKRQGSALASSGERRAERAAAVDEARQTLGCCVLGAGGAGTASRFTEGVRANEEGLKVWKTFAERVQLAMWRGGMLGND
jgi:hypothetical protein